MKNGQPSSLPFSIRVPSDPRFTQHCEPYEAAFIVMRRVLVSVPKRVEWPG